MAGHDLGPKMFDQDRRFWIVGPTYDLGEKEFRVVWDDIIVKMGLGKDKRVKKAYNKRSGDMFIEMPWKTRLEVRSADHPDNLVGEALDGVIMSEAAKHREETFNRFIRPALTDKRGFADFPTTPEGFNWFHNIWQYGNSSKFPDYESWRFPSWANSAVYPGGRDDAEIKLIESTSSPEWFMQEIGADFASFVGKIFPYWDEFTHVTDVTFNPDWPNYIAFDWGFTNPLAAVEFQVSPDDQIYIWREHYKKYTTLPDHIAQLKARDNPPGYRLDLAFGDAADPEAAMIVTQNLVPCLAMKEAKSQYTWGDGIDLMTEFMRPRTSTSLVVVDEFGTPAPDEVGYHVDHSCTNVIKEHNNYRSQNPIKGRNVPEFGAKVDDHTVDAIRYALVHLYKLGVTSSLADTVTPYRPGEAISTAPNLADRGLVTAGSVSQDVPSISSGGSYFGIDGMEF